MRKTLLTIASILFVMLLAGCQLQIENKKANQSRTENKKTQKEIEKIKEVSISRTRGLGGINENYFITIKGPENLKVFSQALNNSEEKKINNRSVDYDLVTSYENGGDHILHLKLGEEGERSMFMYDGHEETGYFTSIEATKSLRSIINPGN